MNFPALATDRKSHEPRCADVKGFRPFTLCLRHVFPGALLGQRHLAFLRNPKRKRGKELCCFFGGPSLTLRVAKRGTAQLQSSRFGFRFSGASTEVALSNYASHPFWLQLHIRATVRYQPFHIIISKMPDPWKAIRPRSIPTHSRGGFCDVGDGASCRFGSLSLEGAAVPVILKQCVRVSLSHSG